MINLGMVVLVSLLLGYIIGLLQNGINISITQKEPERPKKQDYNKSVNPNQQVKEYYQETGGMNKF